MMTLPTINWSFFFFFFFFTLVDSGWLLVAPKFCLVVLFLLLFLFGLGEEHRTFYWLDPKW